MNFSWPIGCFAVHKVALSDKVKTAVISRKLSFVLLFFRSDGNSNSIAVIWCFTLKHPLGHSEGEPQELQH